MRFLPEPGVSFNAIVMVAPLPSLPKLPEAVAGDALGNRQEVEEGAALSPWGTGWVTQIQLLSTEVSDRLIISSDNCNSN